MYLIPISNKTKKYIWKVCEICFIADFLSLEMSVLQKQNTSNNSAANGYRDIYSGRQ
jgi:hypothetical protein